MLNMYSGKGSYGMKGTFWGYYLYHSNRRSHFSLNWNSSGSVYSKILRAFELWAWEDLVTRQIQFMIHEFKLVLGIQYERAESFWINSSFLCDSYHLQSWPRVKTTAWEAEGFGIWKDYDGLFLSCHLFPSQDGRTKLSPPVFWINVSF